MWLSIPLDTKYLIRINRFNTIVFVNKSCWVETRNFWSHTHLYIMNIWNNYVTCHLTLKTRNISQKIILIQISVNKVLLASDAAVNILSFCSITNYIFQLRLLANPLIYKASINFTSCLLIYIYVYIVLLHLSFSNKYLEMLEWSTIITNIDCKYVNGLVQDCSYSIPNALELLESCAKLLMCSVVWGQ